MANEAAAFAFLLLNRVLLVLEALDYLSFGEPSSVKSLLMERVFLAVNPVFI